MQNPTTPVLTLVRDDTPRPDPVATVARLMLARGWDATTAWALFDGLDVPAEYPARIAAAIDEARSAS